MLHDRVRIHVQAGTGGHGSASFRREAHVPRGGPDGGDGGRGGDVVVLCEASLRDLQGFRRRAHYRAGRGGQGAGSLRHGADGQALELRVPPGTEISGADEDLEGRRWELLAGGQRALIARGGTGGRGNKRFATPTRQAPRFAERGLPGEQGWLDLRLKLLADVGLVGLPNAGKSSLLARLTRAAPKVADYPFTTLEPVLGVLDGLSGSGGNGGAHGAGWGPDRQLVLADIPGLIAGASEGAGLGHEFLAHIERTKLLVHVLDIAPELATEAATTSARGPAGEAQAARAGAELARLNHAVIERELAAHDPRLAALPRVLALSKADLVSAERVREAVREWSERLGPEVPVIVTSSASGVGLAELAGELLRRDQLWDPAAGVAPGDPGRARRAVPAPASPHPGDTAGPGEEELPEHVVFRPGAEQGFRVCRLRPGAFAVTGRGIELLLARYDPENEDAMAYLEERLARIGVLRALEDEGFRAGDELEIAGVPFDLDPGR